MGISFKDTWAYRLNKEIGYDKFLSLAAPARSIAHICNEIYSYVEKFGHPDTIIVLFPSPDREIVISSNVNNKATPRSITIDEKEKERFFIKNKRKIFKNKKDKYFLDQHQEIFKIESRTYNSIKTIKNLEIFLKSLNIRFFWSTWDEQMAMSIRNAKIVGGVDLFLNYVFWSSLDKETFLKENILAPESEDNKTWLSALDQPNPHPGVIEQMFYLNLFKKEFELAAK
jgi:hypothetical protein